jgi:hypothetical protein
MFLTITCGSFVLLNTFMNYEELTITCGKLILPFVYYISDEDLFQASPFRSGKRLPVISWCDPGMYPQGSLFLLP